MGRVEHQARIDVAVRTAEALHARPRLFAALSEAFSGAVRGLRLRAAAAVIELGDVPPEPHGVPVFAALGEADVREEVRLADQATGRPPRARGSRCSTAWASRWSRRAWSPGPTSGDVWTISGGRPTASAAALPELPADQLLYSLLSERAVRDGRR